MGEGAVKGHVAGGRSTQVVGEPEGVRERQVGADVEHRGPIAQALIEDLDAALAQDGIDLAQRLLLTLNFERQHDLGDAGEAAPEEAATAGLLHGAHDLAAHGAVGPCCLSQCRWNSAALPCCGLLRADKLATMEDEGDAPHGLLTQGPSAGGKRKAREHGGAHPEGHPAAGASLLELTACLSSRSSELQGVQQRPCRAGGVKQHSAAALGNAPAT
mmetsp:Transcript_39037/g.118079  ORF Transcript_39037/g.118079 Transcript_39037/m.118079 type:complete len:216 (+) Transcript_39037:279-926(+)